jgi:hypothetical protein
MYDDPDALSKQHAGNQWPSALRSGIIEIEIFFKFKGDL